jgi:predicted lipoprotein
VATSTGCKRTPRREAILESLVSDVVLDENREALAQSRELEAKTEELMKAPSPDALKATRQAWKRAAIAWKRASAFSLGPPVESGALSQATYFPARKAALDKLLTETSPVSRELVQELGSDVKGVYGLEELLFDGRTPAPVRVAGESGDRARLLAGAFASDLVALSESTLVALGEPGQGFSKKFAAEGHESVSRLVNQMIEATETMAEGRLSLVLWMDKVNRLEPRDVEGFTSGISHELQLALLLGLQRLYRGGTGGGISDLTSAIAPPIAERVERAFEHAVGQMRHLGRPLERLVKEDRAKLESALGAVKELEVAIKADMASALSVTLTFRSGDGD